MLGGVVYAFLGSRARVEQHRRVEVVKEILITSVAVVAFYLAFIWVIEVVEDAGRSVFIAVF